MKPLVALTLALTLAAPLHAGNCHTLYAQRVYAAPVVAAYVAPVHYAVGQSIIDDANRTKLAEDIAARVLAGLKAQGANAPAAATPGTLGITAAPLLSSRCLKCHSGVSAKGDVRFDRPVSAATKLRVIEMLGLGKDIPPQMAGVMNMSTAEKGQLTEELLNLRTVEAITEEVPPPEPEAGELK